MMRDFRAAYGPVWAMALNSNATDLFVGGLTDLFVGSSTVFSTLELLGTGAGSISFVQPEKNKENKQNAVKNIFKMHLYC